MFVIIGLVVGLGSVFGGYVLAGGYLSALWQPLEVLMILGGGIGAFIMGNTLKVMKATGKTFPSVFGGSKFTKALYMELFALLYEILTKIRKDGLMSIEGDIDAPKESALFQKYPKVMKDHHVMDFVTDYLRLMVGGNMNALEIEALMDQELETHHHEGEIPVHAVAKLADALPAFGIIAAVMGVVKTMGSLHLPPGELGILIAHALVGTFLGILFAYGVFGPIATVIEQKHHESSKMLQCIKVTLLASMNGYAPQVAVEFGRKVVFSTERPGFSELEEHVKQSKNAG
ncbi:MAG: flagellar motor stator protein MotA [Thiotrichales bacterium]